MTAEQRDKITTVAEWLRSEAADLDQHGQRWQSIRLSKQAFLLELMLASETADA